MFFDFQQELTAKILHLENPVKFINISKEGYLGLWTTNLNLEKTYSAAEEADESSAASAGNGGQGRRRAGMWITDAIYMADAHKLVLASTSRDLRFFTISSETFLEDFALFGENDLSASLDPSHFHHLFCFRRKKCSNLFRLLSKFNCSMKIVKHFISKQDMFFSFSY